MQINEQEALKQLAKQGVKIPPQPRVLLELQKLLASEDYDMRSVSKVITQDPGIVSLLFKATRSPAFARARNAKTLDQILMVVGIKQVFSLVQAVSLTTTICDSTRRAFDIFWNRAHEIAQMASIIADDRVSVCNVFPEQAYLAGIFHECGVPVLMMRFPKYCETLKLENATCWPNLSAEDTKFDVDHCSVGYLVARHWGLPDFVCDAIRFHHDLPEEKTIGASVSLVAIVQAASHFYHRLHDVDDSLWDKIGPRVISELGLGQDEEKDFYELMSGRFLDKH
ncbi:MAG: HDOD domain-containing protein [Rhodocyclaceae bacterium]|nr:HDOD domain-containing protein [Rhodocyclaceae bacterium]MDZ4214896.1 HDOD domain-containing protein [Rhodocyclaceae bacterium]